MMRAAYAATCLLISALAAESGQATTPASTARQLWAVIESTPWGMEYREWQRLHPDARCELKDDGWSFGPEDCWVQRCKRRTGTTSFFADGINHPGIRLEQNTAVWRTTDSSAAQSVLLALERLVDSRLGPGQSLRNEHENRLAFEGEVRDGRVWYSNTRVVIAARTRTGVELVGYHGELARAVRADSVVDVSPRVQRILDRVAIQFRERLPWLSAVVAKNALPEPELHRWIDALLDSARGAPPHDREAMWLVADALAARWARMLPDFERQPHFVPLIGAKEDSLLFEYEPLGSAWSYTHGLLWRLWNSADDPAAREEAFVLLLDHGLDTRCCCGWSITVNQYPHVIDEGARFLKAHPESPHAFEVDVSLAQAYETWWSLSRSDRDEYVDPADHAPGAKEARLKAIEHYIRALERAPNGSAEAAEIRMRIPALKLEIDTRQRKFWCFYD